MTYTLTRPGRYDVFIDGQSVGHITWTNNHICVLNVEREHRRRNYGSNLLKNAETEIGMKYDQVSLLAYPIDNTSHKDIIAFYSKHGYNPLTFWQRMYSLFWYGRMCSGNLLVKDFKNN
jgi:ribosomal protein S18 acetylase RimI-like enzyme